MPSAKGLPSVMLAQNPTLQTTWFMIFKTGKKSYTENIII